MERDQLVHLSGRERRGVHRMPAGAYQRGRFWVSDLRQPAFKLMRTYARRERYTRQLGIPSLAFTAAVDALHRHGEQPIKLVS